MDAPRWRSKLGEIIRPTGAVLERLAGRTPSLEVVIVGATGYKELLRTTLRALLANPYTGGDTRVHVVDNASSDGSREMVTTEFSSVVLHEMGWNAGFCAANNAVLREVQSPLVLLLNPDTEMYSGALDHMVAFMDANLDVGVATCRLELADGTLDHAAKRSFPTPMGAVAYFVGLGRRSGGRRAQYLAPEVGEYECGEVDAVNGAFMLVRTGAMRDVGLLDERYWMYAEDLDWCYRFKARGWKVWYEGSVSIMHAKGGGTKDRGHRALRSNIAFHRAMGRFYRKFQAGRNPLVDIAVYLGIGAKLAMSVSRSTVARRSVR